jgi:hypothetical protein
MNLYSSIFQTVFGCYLIIGDNSFRRFFIEVLSFSLYIHCSIASTLLSLTGNLFEGEVYNSVLEMYRTLPYKVIHHFFLYPEAFVFCGWFMAIYGLGRIVRHFKY